MTFTELSKSRFSCRKFSDKKISRDDLLSILEAGNLAPTAKNLQPQRIYVLESEDSLSKLDSLTHCRYGAKTVLLFAYNTDEEWKNPLEEGVHSGVEDVSIVATHVMLRAAEMGLSSCWCNYFSNSKLEEFLGLPKNEKSVLVMSLGYAAEDAKPAPLHEKKKALEETVKWM